MMRGRIVVLSCFLICLITISTYWFRATDSDGNHQSLSDLLAPLSSTSTVEAPDLALTDQFPIDKKVAVQFRLEAAHLRREDTVDC